MDQRALPRVASPIHPFQQESSLLSITLTRNCTDSVAHGPLHFLPCPGTSLMLTTSKCGGVTGGGAYAARTWI
jgi:hypothetical protein